jgi:calcineurin-like phosphoesterase family protein
MKTFVTADTHFGHANVIKFCKRPYLDATQMDVDLIDRWNRVVRPDDLVVHAGDVFWRTVSPARRRDIFKRLNGHKVLVVGNHDDRATLALPWSSVQGSMNLSAKGVDFHVTHYPPDRAALGKPGRFALHGHIHSLETRMPTYDVGVDANDYEPIALDDLADLAKDYVRRWKRLAELAR